jgi:acetyl esterase
VPGAKVDLVSYPWGRDMFGNWAGPARWDDPYVAPGLSDPAGLPPTYVLTCGRDSLRRASEPSADRLPRAGVPVWQDLFAESEHAPLDRPGTPDGEQAVQRLTTWVIGRVEAMEGRPFPAGRGPTYGAGDASLNQENGDAQTGG